MSTPHARGSETSRLAAISIEPDTNRMRRAVLETINNAAQYGLTCDEVEVIRGMSHQTTSARICELRNRKDIEPLVIDGAEVRRPTRSGRFATVYVATEQDTTR